MPRVTHIDFVDTYKAGDPPPAGYVAWSEWAEVQTSAGLKQVRCANCAKWNFPQELSGRTVTTTATTRSGKAVVTESPVCLKCFKIMEAA